MNFSTFTVGEERTTTFKKWDECRELKEEMFAWCREHPEQQFQIGKANYQSDPVQFYTIKRVR